MADLEYAVKAETHDGNVMTLRRGFASQDSAEDHPVQMSLWKKVWVEPIGEIKNSAVEPQLPPFPWELHYANYTDARGQCHVYLVDATGRKIAAIWGKDREKALIANHIITAVNAHALPSDQRQTGERT